jgi:hypothetical protein
MANVLCEALMSYPGRIGIYERQLRTLRVVLDYRSVRAKACLLRRDYGDPGYL